MKRRKIFFKPTSTFFPGPALGWPELRPQPLVGGRLRSLEETVSSWWWSLQPANDLQF